MPDPRSASLNTSLTVTGDEAHITMGDLELTVPVDRIEALVRVLEAASIIAESPLPEAEADATGVRERVARRAASERSAKKARTTRKRRSRKRVGDALVAWMQQNPGWHHEEDLLQAVVNNRMTDASPKRALKIALGKQKDDVFETEGKGHWKLVSDKEAGPPPAPKKRKKAVRKKATSSQAAQRLGTRKRTTSAPGGKLAESAKAVQRSGRRLRLRTKDRTREETPEESGEATAAAAPKEEDKGGRVVRVRRGERRKEVTRPRDRTESEKKAAEQARGGSSGQPGRWSIPEDQLERARRNLLNLGSKGTPVKEAPSGEGDE